MWVILGVKLGLFAVTVWWLVFEKWKHYALFPECRFHFSRVKAAIFKTIALFTVQLQKLKTAWEICWSVYQTNKSTGSRELIEAPQNCFLSTSLHFTLCSSNEIQYTVPSFYLWYLLYKSAAYLTYDITWLENQTGAQYLLQWLFYLLSGSMDMNCFMSVNKV